MGANVSTQVQDVINTTINKITSKIENECSQRSENIQTFRLKIGNISGCKENIFNDINQSTTVSYNASCTQTTLSANDMQQILSNELENYQKTNSGFLSLNANVNTAVANLKNVINNEVNNEKLSKSLQENIAKQAIDLEMGNITCARDGNFNISRITQIIVSNGVYNTLQTNEELNKMVTELDNAIKQTSDITSKGIAEFITALGSLGGIIFLAIIAVIFFAGRKGSTGQGQDNIKKNKLYLAALVLYTVLVATTLGMLGSKLKNYEASDVAGCYGLMSVCGAITLVALILYLYMYFQELLTVMSKKYILFCVLISLSVISLIGFIVLFSVNTVELEKKKSESGN